MLEVVEKEVTKTEVETVAVFICDMCGEKVNAVSSSNENGSCVSPGPEWVKVLNKDICPTCAEKVRGFIGGDEVFVSSSVPWASKFDELGRRLTKQIEKNHNYLSRIKEMQDKTESLKKIVKNIEHDNEKLEKERDELKARVEELEKKDRIEYTCEPWLIDKHLEAAFLKKLQENLARSDSHKPTTYAEACAGLKPFDQVLVRDEIGYTWRARNFELMHESFVKIFLCTDGEDYRFCLPYEPYNHLLGTADSPWEE